MQHKFQHAQKERREPSIPHRLHKVTVEEIQHTAQHHKKESSPTTPPKGRVDSRSEITDTKSVSPMSILDTSQEQLERSDSKSGASNLSRWGSFFTVADDTTDTFENSMAKSFMGDWDPEQEISLFYTKYHEMGKFDVGNNIGADGKATKGAKSGDKKDESAQKPGFFEALGKAVDDVQRMVCADAEESRRCEPPTQCGSVTSSNCSIHLDKDVKL